MQPAKRLAIVIAALVPALSGIATSASEASLSQLSWLGGCWNLQGTETGSGEQWMPLAGGSMLGVSRVIHQS